MVLLYFFEGGFVFFCFLVGVLNTFHLSMDPAAPAGFPGSGYGQAQPVLGVCEKERALGFSPGEKERKRAPPLTERGRERSSLF